MAALISHPAVKRDHSESQKWPLILIRSERASTPPSDRNGKGTDNIFERLATSEKGQKRDFATFFACPISLIGRSGSSAFRLSTTAVVNVARGLVLLYGIGA
jgi:hypothetical protein